MKMVQVEPIYGLGYGVPRTGFAGMRMDAVPARRVIKSATVTRAGNTNSQWACAWKGLRVYCLLTLPGSGNQRRSMMARDNTPETPVANGPYKARSRSGCVTCRQRHLKCDEIKPTCGRCRKSRRQCVPTDLDHRATRGSVVRFVDESSRFYRRSGTREPDDEPPAGWSVTEVGINSPTATIFEQQVGLAQPLTERLLSPPRDETDSELGSFETITDRSVVDDDRSTNERQNTHDSQGNHRTTLGSPQSPFETTAWWNQISSKRAVLDDYEVYRLMRHYVEVVGPWLDLTDSKRHYSTVVPQLALKCPVLMNAILAFSARHLHRLEGYEAMIAEYYHNEAIKVMIPMLQDQAVANDGTLLATTIILRMYETLERKHVLFHQYLSGYRVTNDPQPQAKTSNNT
jgi:hypothetical protein